MVNSDIVFETLALDDLKRVIDNACIKKHAYSNYFGIDLNNVKCYGDEDNLFLVKQYDGFSRVYMMANDEEMIKAVLKSLSENSCINIPSKKGIELWLSILAEAGYNQIATYRRYAYVNYRKGNDKNLFFAEMKDLQLIESELHSFFSPLTGHLPNTSELAKMIEGKQIVVNRDENGVVNGGLCYQITGKKAELPFWFDRSGDGLALLFKVFFLCHQFDVRQIIFWVNDVNENTIAIHNMLGAKTDGLVDYIFNKE